MGNKYSSISPEDNKKYVYNKNKLNNELKILNKSKTNIRLPNKNLNLKLTPEDVKLYRKKKDELYKINQKIEKIQRELKYNSYKNKILPYSDNIILPQSDISNSSNYNDGISYRRRKSKSKRRKYKSRRRKSKSKRHKAKV